MAAVLNSPPIAIKKVAPSPRAKGAAGQFAFGKYREIIIAVAFFLLFDLGVLVLNFYTSFKIDQDTEVEDQEECDRDDDFAVLAERTQAAF